MDRNEDFLVTFPDFPRFLRAVLSSSTPRPLPALEDLCLKKKSWFVHTPRSFFSPKKNVVGAQMMSSSFVFPESYNKTRKKKTIPGTFLVFYVSHSGFFRCFQLGDREKWPKPSFWWIKCSLVSPGGFLLNTELRRAGMSWKSLWGSLSLSHCSSEPVLSFINFFTNYLLFNGS